MHTSDQSSTNRLGLGRGDLVAIAIGGVLGAAVRSSVAASSDVTDNHWFTYTPNPELTLAIDAAIPGRTLIVNLIGCLLLGAFTVMLTWPTLPTQRRVLIGLATGFCGSLTTFSSFAVEAADLLGARFDANTSAAMSYLATSILGGAIAFWIGRTVAARSVLAPGARTLR